MNLCRNGQINSFQSSQHLFKNHSPTGHRVALFGVGNIGVSPVRALTLSGWLGGVSIESAGHVGVGSFGASPVRALTNLSKIKLSQIPPSTAQYRPKLTQYHQVLTSTALYWPSTTKYQPVPPYTDPVPPSTNSYRPILTQIWSRPLFEILTISANILSFSFWEFNADW